MARADVRGYVGSFHFAGRKDPFFEPRLAQGKVMFPKPRPVICVEWIQLRVAWNNRTQIGPVGGRLDQSSVKRIEKYVVSAGDAEGAAVTFPGPQDVIVGLMLETGLAEAWPQLGAKEFDPIALVRVVTEAHPNEMQVIWHQAIGWAKQTLTRGRMKHQFPKSGMKPGVEPTSSAMRNRHGPENNRVCLVKLTAESRKIVRKSGAALWVKLT